MSNAPMRVTLAFLLASAALVAAETTCTPQVEGATWDLSTLAHESDYTGTDGTYDYVMNLCQIALKADCADNQGAICQYNPKDIITADAIVATLAKYTGADPPPEYTLLEDGNPSAGITLTYLNGDICYIENVKTIRTAIINMHCASSLAGATFDISEDSATCVFTININAKEACPTSGGSPLLSGGSIFLVSLAVVIVLYLSIGIGLQKRKGETGRGLCPNAGFWSSVFPLVGEGITFTIHKCKTFRQSGEQYDEL